MMLAKTHYEVVIEEAICGLRRRLVLIVFDCCIWGSAQQGLYIDGWIKVNCQVVILYCIVVLGNEL